MRACQKPRPSARPCSVASRLCAPSPDLKLANRELGTVEGIGQDGRRPPRRPCSRALSGDASAPRSWLRGHKSFQPGTDRRPCADPRRYRAGGPKTCSTTASLTLPFRAALTMHKFSRTTEKSSRKRWVMMFRTRAPIFRSNSRRSLRSPRLRSRRRVKAWTLD